ncbi:MAG: hypothetical protein ABT940_12660 [Alphaproteobacteria bacterium]
MRKFCLLSGMILLAVYGSALAEEPAGKVDRAACAKLVAYVPPADIAYKPGVDVKGKPVAPAEIGGGSPIKVPDSIEFNPTVNPVGFGTRNNLNREKAALATQSGTLDKQAVIDQKLAAVSAKGLDGTSMKLGAVRYDINTNQLTYDGKPLTDSQTATLDQACRKAGYR